MRITIANWKVRIMVKKAFLITFVSFNLLFSGLTTVSFAEDIIPSEEAHRLYAAANQLEEMQRFEEAKSLYQQVLQQYPNSLVAAGAKLHFSRFNVLSQIAAGNQAAADAEVNEITAEFPDHPDLPWYLYGVANQYEELGRYEEAKNLYQQILQQYPDSPVAAGAELHFSRFNVLSQIIAGDETNAETEINSIESKFQSHPDFPWYLYSVANQYEERRKDDEAKAIYQQILQQYPDSPVAGGARLHFSRYNVSLLIASGNDTAVRSEIDGIAADLPGHPDLQWYFSNIANQYQQLGNYSMANEVRDLYQQTIQESPNGSSEAKPGFKYSRAEVQFLVISQKYDEAKAAFDKLIADFSGHPDLPDALYGIAQKYEWSDKNEESKSTYQQIVQNYPNSPAAAGAQLYLSRFNVLSLIESGDDPNAQAAVETLITDFNDHPGLPRAISQIEEAYFIRILAAETRVREDFLPPVEIWEKVITKFPDFSYPDPELYCFIASCYYQLGKYEEAIGLYRKVAANWPDYQAWGTLSLIEECYEGLKEAGAIGETEADTRIEQNYNEIIENSPTSVSAKYACMKLGRKYFDSRRWADAALYFELLWQNFPDYPHLVCIVYRLGRAYEQMGETAMAMETCEEFLKDHPTDVRIKALLEELKATNK
jgi:TolA-binding protein